MDFFLIQLGFSKINCRFDRFVVVHLIYELVMFSLSYFLSISSLSLDRVDEIFVNI